jgi:hypothetical protein
MSDMDDRHGFTFRIGVQKVARSDPYPNRNRARTIALWALAVIAVGLVWLAFPSQHHATPQTAVTAHVQPLPAAAPTVATVAVSGAMGAVCVLPTGKAKTVKLVKIP